jgi:hypothetical protein
MAQGTVGRQGLISQSSGERRRKRGKVPQQALVGGLARHQVRDSLPEPARFNCKLYNTYITYYIIPGSQLDPRTSAPRGVQVSAVWCKSFTSFRNPRCKNPSAHSTASMSYAPPHCAFASSSDFAAQSLVALCDLLRPERRRATLQWGKHHIKHIYFLSGEQIWISNSCGAVLRDPCTVVLCRSASPPVEIDFIV